jgi:hypothetical protein
VARWLEGRRIDDNLEIEVISRWWHSFPCTAGMERDPELDGDTPLHMAGQAHYAILAPHKRVAGLEPNLVVSPLGTTVQRPIPPRENLERIESAKEAIHTRLMKEGGLSLQELRKTTDANPAAINSALLILMQGGKIRSEGSMFYPVGESAPGR